MYLILLVILWDIEANAEDCYTLLSRIQSIRDRYRAYFIHRSLLETDEKSAEAAIQELYKILRTI